MAVPSCSLSPSSKHTVILITFDTQQLKILKYNEVNKCGAGPPMKPTSQKYYDPRPIYMQRLNKL